jgi:hypothetical protein
VAAKEDSNKKEKIKLKVSKKNRGYINGGSRGELLRWG